MKDAVFSAAVCVFVWPSRIFCTDYPQQLCAAGTLTTTKKSLLDHERHRPPFASSCVGRPDSAGFGGCSSGALVVVALLCLKHSGCCPVVVVVSVRQMSQ